MIAYVDEFGNVTDTPPDPAEREEINAEDIELGIPKKEKLTRRRSAPGNRFVLSTIRKDSDSSEIWILGRAFLCTSTT